MENETPIEKEKSNNTVIPCSYCEFWWHDGELPKHDPNCPVNKESNED